MRDLIDHRLTELRAELEAGHRLQAELDRKQDELRRSMLRISGAIQVLGELTAAADEHSGTLADIPHQILPDVRPNGGAAALARRRAG
jgi:hypothetical protein